jgi:hypothetical protein
VTSPSLPNAATRRSSTSSRSTSSGNSWVPMTSINMGNMVAARRAGARKRGGYLTVTARVTSFFVSPGCTAPLYSSRMISLSSFEYRVGADQYLP